MNNFPTAWLITPLKVRTKSLSVFSESLSLTVKKFEYQEIYIAHCFIIEYMAVPPAKMVDYDPLISTVIAAFGMRPYGFLM